MDNLNTMDKISNSYWPLFVITIPLLSRVILLFLYKRARNLPIEAPQAEQHRTLIFGIAGFSLTGFSIVATSNSAKNFSFAVYDILLSFLINLFALGVQ